MNGLQDQLARSSFSVPHALDGMSTPRRYPLTLALAVMGAAHASVLQGQEPLGGASPDSLQAVEAQESSGRPSAGWAFARSMVIPGWGQAVVGSPGRGAFYFTVQSLSVWMILKTMKLTGGAEDIL